jgi:hypothetical protein
MALKDRLENNLIVIIIAVAVTSGGVVAGVMSFVHQATISGLQSEHRLEVSQKDAEIGELGARITGLNDQLDQQSTEMSDLELVYRFASLHSRVLTYAAVNQSCQPFGRGFGELLSGAQWDLPSLRTRYETTVSELVSRNIATQHFSRAGSSSLAFVGGTTWPVAELYRCPE